MKKLRCGFKMHGPIGCNCLLTQPLKEDNTCHNLWHYGNC